MVLGVNGYKEMCTLHLAGQVCLVLSSAAIKNVHILAGSKSTSLINFYRSVFVYDFYFRIVKNLI